MENKKNNILLIIIIIILAILCVLFATNTITLNKKEPINNKEETETQKNDNNETKENQTESKEPEENTNYTLYQNFIDYKGYLNNASSEAEAINNIKYAYYDLDNNGIDELIIYSTDSGDFGNNYFYTISNGEVTFISKIYHYGNLSYNTDDSTIVYTEVRPSQSYGYAYGFYKLKQNKFELEKTLGVNIENGKKTYYIDDKTITEEEYDKHFKNNISFNYKEIK